MPIQDAQKIKEEILTFLELNGPSLPVQISRYIRIDTLFTSAFLSELLSNQQIKISTLKVGSSPVYYLPGTEAGLEKYSEYLKSKEKEAFELLKQKKFIEDEKQEAAIKVALRQIRDYAKAFEKNEKIIWRYYLVPEEEYTEKENIQKRETIKPKIELKEKIIESKKENIEEIKEIEHEKKEVLFLNPLAKKEIPKQNKEKPKSEFIEKTIKFIEKNDWLIIQELGYKPKEYNCYVQIPTSVGPITFKTIAKDKKTINETDFMKLLSEAQTIPLPGLFLSTGDIQKKSLPLLEKYNSILKFKKIE